VIALFEDELAGDEASSPLVVSRTALAAVPFRLRCRVVGIGFCAAWVADFAGCCWFLGFVVRLMAWGFRDVWPLEVLGPEARSSAGDHYIARVSGLGDRAVDDGAGADGSCGAGGVSGAAGCGVAAGGWGTAAGCFFWALLAAALRVRVFAAFCPAARCFRVETAFLAATRRLRVTAAFAAAARRFAAFRLRVVAAFFPALFLGLISSSVAIRKGFNLKLLVYARAAFWRTHYY